MIKDILLVVLGAVLAFGGQYTFFKLTSKSPSLELIISKPRPVHAVNEVHQIITVRNKGSTKVQGIIMTIDSIGERIYRRRITGRPGLLKPCEEQRNEEDDVHLICGDLKPNGIITIYLKHKRPTLSYEHIDAYADNTTASKLQTEKTPDFVVERRDRPEHFAFTASRRGQKQATISRRVSK